VWLATIAVTAIDAIATVKTEARIVISVPVSLRLLVRASTPGVISVPYARGQAVHSCVLRALRR
jgi:uncharacterized protein YfaS (alpha-2-macroglobulin family)